MNIKLKLYFLNIKKSYAQMIVTYIPFQYSSQFSVIFEHLSRDREIH